MFTGAWNKSASFQSERGGGEKILLFTSSVKSEGTFDHAVHETAHGVELLIGLEEKESVEVPCVIDRHRQPSDGFKSPLHGFRQE